MVERFLSRVGGYAAGQSIGPVMKSLNDLRLFVRAARAASLSEAARALDLSPAVATACGPRRNWS